MAPTLYRNVLSTAQRKMSASVEQIRDSIPHAGETGELVERVFRNQLLEVLPEKVGVSSGFVLDSHGSISRQMDVILYDRPNTPRIFASDGAQMFPVESTYACGEIKTDMDSTQLADTFEKCHELQAIGSESILFSIQSNLVQSTHSLFGRDWEHWQSIFFCIAARSVKSGTLLPKFNDSCRRTFTRDSRARRYVCRLTGN